MHINRLKTGFFILCGVMAILVSSMPSGQSKNRSSKVGKYLYAQNCQQCHREGRNFLKPEKELVESSKLVSKSSFKHYLSDKHGLMPVFKELASNEQELDELYRYVKTLKNQDWEYTEPEGPRNNLPMKDSAPDSGAQ